MKMLPVLILVFISLNTQIHSQDDQKVFNSNINRGRVLAGYSSLVRDDYKPQMKNIYLNFNYRADNYDPLIEHFKVFWGFELGVNGIAPQPEELNTIIFIPYAKTGPEVSPFENSLIGGSIGLAAINVWESFSVFPFVGVNAFYFAPVNESLSLEFEIGYHTHPASWDSRMIYFALGLGIK